jgi:hypothetical protein
MKVLLVLASTLILQGCAQMYPKTAHLPECKFSNLKPGEKLPHKCGDWGNPGTTTITVRTVGNTTLISTR